MPYTKDESDELPSQDQPIWRYLDLAKFADILVSKHMWFACVEELVKDDPFEGAFPTAHLTRVEKELLGQINVTVNGVPQSEPGDRFIPDIAANIPKLCEAARRSVYCNCWHVSNHESAAMWSLYAKDGLAIKSTVRRLIESFAEEPCPVRISEIDYIDYDTQSSDYSRTHLYKRESFEHEKELRAFVNNPGLWMKFANPHIPQGASWVSPEVHEFLALEYARGIRVKVSPKVLIEEVRLAPTSQQFLVGVLEDVLAKYGLGTTVPVKKSAISEVPQ